MESNEKKDHFLNNEQNQTDPNGETIKDMTEEQNINGMDQDRQESEEADRKEEHEEQKANEGEVSSHEEEGKDPEDKTELRYPLGATDEENNEASEKDSENNLDNGEEILKHGAASENKSQYSCSYTPPYYVPNFTVVDPSVPKEAIQRKSEKKTAHAAGWILFGVALCALVSLVLGCVGGYLGGRFFEQNAGGNSYRGGTANVTKNDGSIVVNEIVGSTGYENLTVAEVVQYVADSVVEITTSQVQNDVFWGNYVTSGAGSGVIIDSNGFILTNNHVIDGATSVTVRLTNGAEYSAAVVGGDADSDIAVLRIDATDLKAAVLGKSGQLKVGEDVVAIGNPLGELGGTVTDGIISALDRQVIVDGYPMTLLQTNAAINPGNSGGGLFNMAGELIGIVNAKQSDTGIEGLGFAIPIDVAWQKASDLMKYGYVTGKIILDFTVEAKTSEFNLQAGNGFFAPTYTFPAGVYVSSSENDSLIKYDRIVSINGISINGISDYYDVIDDLKKGDEMKIGISRLNTKTGRFEEKTVTLNVKVTEPSS